MGEENLLVCWVELDEREIILAEFEDKRFVHWIHNHGLDSLLSHLLFLQGPQVDTVNLLWRIDGRTAAVDRELAVALSPEAAVLSVAGSDKYLN